jgi:uncharacterized protein
MNAAFWISRLELKPHPEGGWFKEIYRSGEILDAACLPDGTSGPRNLCTSIYFLLESSNFSAFHRLRSDELWHFYSGSPLKVYRICSNGDLKTDILSPGTGGCPFLCIPRNTWFAAEVTGDHTYSLIGCSVSPGFDFSDFELAEREELTVAYPGYKELITRLTR